jgi:hypothetical protein
MFCKEFIKGRLFKTLKAKFALLHWRGEKKPWAHLGSAFKSKEAKKVKKDSFIKAEGKMF